MVTSLITFAETSSLVTSIRYELDIVIFFHIFPLHSLTAFIFYVLDIFLSLVIITDLISIVFEEAAERPGSSQEEGSEASGIFRGCACQGASALGGR